ncbi:MAG: branched-chain amino acid ABC transporter substrate-binding protein, partial [Jannaschia helgolandensis]
AEAYDAAALILLAMQAAGSTDPAAYKDSVMDVANAPGEQILPGELAKGLQILKDGGDIDYVGASAVELIGPGESAGNYREVTFENGELVVVGYR